RKRSTRTFSVARPAGRPVSGATRAQWDRGDVPSRPDRRTGRCTVLAPACRRDSRAHGAPELSRARPPPVTAAAMQMRRPGLGRLETGVDWSLRSPSTVTAIAAVYVSTGAVLV